MRFLGMVMKKKRCRDGIVFVCPALPAHCHTYTPFLCLWHCHPYIPLHFWIRTCNNVVHKSWQKKKTTLGITINAWGTVYEHLNDYWDTTQIIYSEIELTYKYFLHNAIQINTTICITGTADSSVVIAVKCYRDNGTTTNSTFSSGTSTSIALYWKAHWIYVYSARVNLHSHPVYLMGCFHIEFYAVFDTPCYT